MRFCLAQWSATRFYGSLSVYSCPLPSEKIVPWQPSKKSPFGDSCFTYSNFILFHTNSLGELYRFETCIHNSVLMYGAIAKALEPILMGDD